MTGYGHLSMGMVNRLCVGQDTVTCQQAVHRQDTDTCQQLTGMVIC